MRHLACACLLALCLASPVPAAEPAADSHRAAAEACVAALGGAEMQAKLIDDTMGFILQQNPDLEPFIDVMTAFFERVMPWSALEPKYVEMYEAAFTEPELKDITAFLGTASGHKYVEMGTTLLDQTAQFANAILMEHAVELQEVIMTRAMELEADAMAEAGADSTGDAAADTTSTGQK